MFSSEVLKSLYFDWSFHYFGLFRRCGVGRILLLFPSKGTWWEKLMKKNTWRAFLLGNCKKSLNNRPNCRFTNLLAGIILIWYSHSVVCLPLSSLCRQCNCLNLLYEENAKWTAGCHAVRLKSHCVKILFLIKDLPALQRIVILHSIVTDVQMPVCLPGVLTVSVTYENVNNWLLGLFFTFAKNHPCNK